MTDIHQNCKKMKAFAWAKYYKAISDENDFLSTLLPVIKNIDKDNLPKHITIEFIEMAEKLKIKHTCPICLEIVNKDNIEITFCGHIYDKVCLQQVKQNSQKCAICRKTLK